MFICAHFVAYRFYTLSCPMVHPNHRRPLPLKLQKPLKNNRNQRSSSQKRFNGDDPTVSKPLKQQKSKVAFEKTLTIPSLKKIDNRRGLLSLRFRSTDFYRSVTVRLARTRRKALEFGTIVERCRNDGFHMGKHSHFCPPALLVPTSFRCRSEISFSS